MAVESSGMRDADVPALFRMGLMRSVPFLLARFQQSKRDLLEHDRKQAQRVLSYIIKVDEAWPQVRELLLVMAPQMEQAGHREDWMAFLKNGIQKSQKQADTQTEAELRFHLGLLYEQLARYDEAGQELEFSAAYFEQVGRHADQGRALNRLAYVMRRQRQFSEARQLVEVVLQLSHNQPSEQAYSYLVLGTIALDKREWQNAYRLFSTSLALWQETEDQRMIAWSLSNLGMAVERDKRYTEAIVYYQRAIKLFETIQDPLYEAVARMNLGNSYFRLKGFEEALKLYLKAELTFRKTQARLYLAKVSNNKGMLYQKLTQWEDAKQAYLISIELWQQIGNINSLVNTMDNLGLLYFEQGLHDEAKATWQDALNKLAQIKGQPGYDYLFDMVSRNLEQITK